MYGDKISIVQEGTKRGKIVFNSKIRLEDTLRKENDIKRRLEIQVRDAALALREDLRQQSPQKLPENLKIADIFQGEVNVPDNLHLFLNYLISGPDPRKQSSSNKQRRIIGEDIIYAVSSGAKIPAKHLQVGLAMKSLTGSRKVTEVLNRLGHSISYSAAQEIKTELTLDGTKENRLILQQMTIDSEAGVRLAFDNFDRFVEKLNGKDTLTTLLELPTKYQQKINIRELNLNNHSQLKQ